MPTGGIAKKGKNADRELHAEKFDFTATGKNPAELPSTPDCVLPREDINGPP